MSDRETPGLLARRKLAPHRIWLFAVTAILLFFSACTSENCPVCTSQKENTYDPGTADIKIMSMFALRDLECGTTHQLSGILVTRADRKSVDLCVQALFLLDCTAWQASDPSPAVCKSIGVSFR